MADELSLALREQPFHVSRLLARARRLASGLPTVWAAYVAGDLDAEQVRVVDRVARRVTEAATLAALDEQVVDAAQTRSPKQLGLWALKLVVALEPEAFCRSASPRSGGAAGHRGAGRGRDRLRHWRGVRARRGGN